MLRLIGSHYHFRRAIPQDLKALLGRSEISLSLRTDKKLIARERAADLYTRTGGFFHKARTLDEQASPSLFQRAGSDTKTVEAIRSLITRINLILEDGVLGIFLEGDLAAMLSFATNRKNTMHHPDAGVFSKFLVQDSVVAGTCNRRKLRSSSNEQATLVAGARNQCSLLLVSGFVERIAA